MAVPSLPSAKNTNDILDVAWLGAVRDLLELFRDTGPSFYGRNDDNQWAYFGSDHEIRFSDGDGAFDVTPVVNVGGWTAADDGEHGIVVPLTGRYQVTGWASFDTGDVEGVRRAWLIKNGTEIGGSRVAQIPTSPSVTTNFATNSVIRAFNAGDILGMKITHNSQTGYVGFAVMDAFLTARWVGAS